ncbi:NBS-LRR type resistance protein [Cucumis melo var. makuwa]|uniref:NBS-LRR type resistance protein n=1 Tax=Cucumis melo var. makuwa TaxID=1194695 RepID=A0A5A7VN96_CUCMM|nr:NBS-LRR type resistance protein [Cucumis melo var. makuwa]
MHKLIKRPVYDSLKSFNTYEKQFQSAHINQSSDLEGYTYQSSDPEGCTYQSSDPEGCTCQSSDPEGCTYQSSDPEGCTFQSSDPEGCTYQSSDPEGCTYQSSDPEGCTYQSRNLEGHRACKVHYPIDKANVTPQSILNRLQQSLHNIVQANSAVHKLSQLDSFGLVNSLISRYT